MWSLLVLAGVVWTLGIPVVTLVAWLRARSRDRDLEGSHKLSEDGRTWVGSLLPLVAVVIGAIGVALMWLTVSWFFSDALGWWGDWWNSELAKRYEAAAIIGGFVATSVAFALGWLSQSRATHRASRSTLALVAMALASVGSLAVVAWAIGAVAALSQLRPPD